MIGEKVLLDPEDRAYAVAARLALTRRAGSVNDIQILKLGIPPAVEFIMESDADFRIALIESLSASRPETRLPQIIEMAKAVVEIRNPVPPPAVEAPTAVPDRAPSETSSSTILRKKGGRRKKTAG